MTAPGLGVELVEEEVKHLHPKDKVILRPRWSGMISVRMTGSGVSLVECCLMVRKTAKVLYR